ncbi:hypothetical protein SAMN02910369_03105, partial [Lachnospiraceae bacterium NE2001]
QPQAVQPQPQPAQPSKPLNIPWKLVGIIGGIAAAVIIAVVVVVSIISNRKVPVTFDEYVTFECEGYDGFGTATAFFDKESFIEDYSDKIKVSREGNKYIKEMYGDRYKEVVENMNPAEEFARALYGEIDKTDQISNGDTITWVWKIDDEEDLRAYFKVEFELNDVEHKVSELDEIGTFDAFEGLELTFEGTAPNGTARIENQKSDGIFDYLSYNILNREGLKNGDEVTVEVTNTWTSDRDELSNSLAQKFGEVPAEWEKTFTVEGLPYYIETVAEIPEDTMTAMQKQMSDYMDSKVARDWDSEVSTLEGMTYIGSYLLIPKESGDKNYLYLVYKMDAWNDSDGYVSYYIYIEFNNLRMVDGLCDVDLNDYSITSNYIEFGGDYYYYGFKNLDEVFSKCVTENLEYYTYDSTVEDVETSSATPTEAEEEE